jgi:hypothetical protein
LTIYFKKLFLPLENELLVLIFAGLNWKFSLASMFVTVVINPCNSHASCIKLKLRMKKAFSLLMAAMFVFATSLSAQTPAAPAKKEVKKEMKKGDKEMKKGEKMGKNMTPPPPPPPPGKVKKDAKAPAAAQAPAQHLKKDGTPDKRFKENKVAPASKHLKKDGTPDKRFKENKDKK